MTSFPLGNRKLIRGINRSIILNVIKREGEISRAAIATLTGLSPATLSGITTQLIKEGLVFEKTTGDSTGGRPPILLALNPEGGFVIGIKLMEGHAVGALTDLNTTVLSKQSVELSDKSVETAASMLVILVNDLIKSGGIKRKNLMGVGIGLAGVVDFERGIVRQNPFFGWKNLGLRKILEARMHVPVYLDNDVNTLSLSEKWMNPSEPEDDFIIITIGRGIGMGIVLNGEVHRGKKGGAGELGHVVIDCNGPLCDCGKHGCLESYISDRALISIANDRISGNISDVDQIIELSREGNKTAIRILEEAGNLLGQQIANLVNIFDPRLIIISGEGIRMGEYFFSAIHQSFQACVMPGLAEDTEIRINSWGDGIWALGAASLVIEEIFKSPIRKEDRN